MTWLRHIGCKTPMIDYSGPIPINYTAMKSEQWRHLDNSMAFSKPYMEGLYPAARMAKDEVCIECGEKIRPHDMETMEGKRIYNAKPKPSDPLGMHVTYHGVKQIADMRDDFDPSREYPY